MKRFLSLLLLSCGGAVYAEPSAQTEPVYTDDTCAARPAAASSTLAMEFVTSEEGWHYDGSDPKVRRFDGTKPSARRTVCWREAGLCPCRLLAPGELAYEVLR